MISTITTVSTVSTISTITTSTSATTTTAASFAAGLGLLATITLIVMLIAKELAGAAAEQRLVPAHELTLPGALDRVLNVGIIPLLILFACIVVSKVASVLN
ncbi:MAG: hypothetical protein ACYC0Q_13395 [Eubacteriales bacterium]